MAMAAFAQVADYSRQQQSRIARMPSQRLFRQVRDGAPIPPSADMLGLARTIREALLLYFVLCFALSVKN
jgi:hypothetical protein